MMAKGGDLGDPNENRKAPNRTRKQPIKN
jgi:hypothetical protein